LYLRVREVDEVVLPIYVVDIEVVSVEPCGRPLIVKREPITAIMETSVLDTFDAKMMLSSERCAETILRNTAVTAIRVLVSVIASLLFRHLLLLSLLLFLLVLLLPCYLFLLILALPTRLLRLFRLLALLLRSLLLLFLLVLLFLFLFSLLLLGRLLFLLLLCFWLFSRLLLFLFKFFLLLFLLRIRCASQYE